MNYRNLVVWQKSDELAFEIYIITKNFPKEEQFGITNQLRRASVSIPVNIAEGSGRQGKNETKHFANIALGSLAETDYLLNLSLRLHFLNDKDYQRIGSIKKEVGALLWRFYKSFSS